MKHIRVPLLVAIAMLAGGCSLFGGDDASTDLSTAETFTPEPTANVVQAVPADDAAAADEPLPTAVTIPDTPVPEEPTPDRSQPITYVVQSGDVLGLIAERFDVDIAELRRVNDLSGNLIRVGQSLTIPALAGSPEADEPGEDESASGVVGSTTAASPAPAPEPVSCGANAVGHCVQSGDSLLGIASQYGTTVDTLRSLNPGIIGDFIKIGDLLTLPGSSAGPDPGLDDEGTPVETVVQPQSDADCEALNPEYPYFHAADGLCYANEIGGTEAPPTDTSGTGKFTQLTLPVGESCPEGAPVYGQFEGEEPACYPIIAAVVPTPTQGPTPTPGGSAGEYYGAPPCDDWESVLETGLCWPNNEATDAQREAGREDPPES